MRDFWCRSSRFGAALAKQVQSPQQVQEFPRSVGLACKLGLAAECIADKPELHSKGPAVWTR